MSWMLWPLANNYTDDYGPWPLMAMSLGGVAVLVWRRQLAWALAVFLFRLDAPFGDAAKIREDRESYAAVWRGLLMAFGVFMVVVSILAIVGLLPGA